MRTPFTNESPRPTRRSGRAPRPVAVALLVAATVGCAASNYDFGGVSGLGAHERGAALSEALARRQDTGRHEELYDLDVLPLVRTHLTVFADSDDEDVPEGTVETEVDAFLPLFGVVDATVRRYDRDHRLYERHRHESYLWGLFQTHREELDTRRGRRERTTHRFLWIFEWQGSPKYAEGAVDQRASSSR